VKKWLTPFKGEKAYKGEKVKKWLTPTNL